MPFIFPKPADWNTFEDIVCDVFARKYQNLNLQRYGRSGQRQQGVDIAGLTTQGMLGVQCKHHPKGDILADEIDKEVSKSEKFTPPLAQYVIATSADRDAKSHGHVLALSQQRQAANAYPVSMKYWDDICGWLADYPDLVYKHFTKFYPHRELEHLFLAGFQSVGKNSISWPFTVEQLAAHTSAALGGLPKTDPYVLSLGLTMFDPAEFAGRTDVDVTIGNPGVRVDDSIGQFSEADEVLKHLKSTITSPFFARKLLIYLQVRLAYAFLLGWTFRKVTGFELLVAVGQEIWPSNGLALTPSMLVDDLPLIKDSQSDEVVVVLNISRDIRASVVDYIATFDPKPKAVVSYRLDGGRVTSAAHALSLALDISQKIKNLIDNWGATRIHLFAALPAALAVLVGHHLNAICPLDIYFLDETRKNYQLGGTITNSL